LVYLFFNKPHKELLPGFQLIDNFSNHFSFNTVNSKDTEVKNTHIYTLNKIFNNFFLNPNTILVISNASIKNNIITSILYIHSGQNILAKTIHYVINITSTKTVLFSIKYGINQAIQVPNVENIIVITNTIHTTR